MAINLTHADMLEAAQVLGDSISEGTLAPAVGVNIMRSIIVRTDNYDEDMAEAFFQIRHAIRGRADATVNDLCLSRDLYRSYEAREA